MQAKQWADAHRVFTLGVERFAQDPTLWFGQGRAWMQMGTTEEAIAALERNLALLPAAATQFRLGEAWAAKGESSRAVTAIEKALAATPALPVNLRREAERRLKSLRSPG